MAPAATSTAATSTAVPAPARKLVSRRYPDCSASGERARRHVTINLAESPLDLVALFRPVIESEVTPEQAVKHYHAILSKKGLAPKRKLEDDLKITEPALEGFKK